MFFVGRTGLLATLLGPMLLGTSLVADAQSCSPSATHGCLDGAPYDWSTQFTCGRHKPDGSPAIYNYSQMSCCAQGLPFNPSNQYCCYSGVWNFNQGGCSDWSGLFPKNCYCDKPLEVPMDSPKTLIKTSQPPPAPACSSPNAQHGCMNGWNYSYADLFPCGEWLMDYSHYGCCATSIGLEPYEFATQSCCKLPGPGHELKPGGHACDCKKYGCS